MEEGGGNRAGGMCVEWEDDWEKEREVDTDFTKRGAGSEVKREVELCKMKHDEERRARQNRHGKVIHK